MSGDSHGHREFSCRPFGHPELAPGFWRLKAERLIPERPTTVAVTRHLELIMPAAYLPVSGLPLSDCGGLSIQPSIQSSVQCHDAVPTLPQDRGNRSARSADPTSIHRDNYVVTRSRPYPDRDMA